LVVSNDTGPGHIAAAVGAPLLSVLGPTDPSRWGAVGPGVHIVQQTAGWPTVEAVATRAQALL
jgi:heptosyltransferase-2